MNWRFLTALGFQYEAKHLPRPLSTHEYHFKRPTVTSAGPFPQCLQTVSTAENLLLCVYKYICKQLSISFSQFFCDCFYGMYLCVWCMHVVGYCAWTLCNLIAMPCSCAKAHTLSGISVVVPHNQPQSVLIYLSSSVLWPCYHYKWNVGGNMKKDKPWGDNGVLFVWFVGWLVGWLVWKKQSLELYFFPVLEQRSLNFEALHWPNPPLNVVIRLTSGQMFLLDFIRKMTDDKVAKLTPWAIV